MMRVLASHDGFSSRGATRLAGLAFACAVALAGFAPAKARACSCAGTPTPREARDQAAAVFEGFVTAVEATGESEGRLPSRRVHVNVVRSWKDAEAETLVLNTAADGATCGYDFEQGQSYLIYASAHEDELWVSLCSRTRPMEEANEDLDALGMGATPVNPQGEIPLPEAQGEPSGSAAPSEPPARGGCASCSSLGAERAQTRLGAVLLAALLALFTYRRRSGSLL